MEGKTKKTKVFKWAAVLMLVAMMIVGCKQAQGNSSSAEHKKPDTPAAAEKYAVSFEAATLGGKLMAKVDGAAISSGTSVEKGKTVTFTATADSGYRVKGWTRDGEAVNGTNDSYSFTVTKGVEVKVSFESNSTPPTPSAYDFVEINPPAAGITGKDPTYSLPKDDNSFKGVFIKDRTVKLSPYSLGKTEVPYKLWKEVYDWAVKSENGYKFANEGVKGKDGNGSEDEPVTMVSWRDCIVWCNAYTQKIKGEGECVYRKKDDHTVVLKDATDTAACDNAYADMSKKGFRLPTEAEWEYAARWQGDEKTNAEQYGSVWLTKLDSASGAKGNWKDAEKTGEVAWYSGNADSKTHPVGTKKANALGLHDMSGNVWEWCFDRYDNIGAGDVTDPLGGAASGSFRVLRGGSWFDDAESCVVGIRGSFKPGRSDDGLGFRVACRP